MAQELAHEILRQAKEQHVADQQEAANRSGALLKLWSWRGKHHAQVNTRFETQWNLRLTPRKELVVAGYGCEFPGYSPLIAQHLAKTFLYQREDDALLMDRIEFGQRCQPYDEAAPCHLDHKDNQAVVDNLKLGNVEVDIYKLPADTASKKKPRLVLRRSCAVDASQVVECVDELLHLYMMATFPQL